MRFTLPALARRVPAAAAATAIAVSATGCWFQPGASPGNTNHNAIERAITVDNVATLAERWSASGSVTAVSGGHAIGVDSTTVRSLDMVTGAVRWRTQLLPPGITSVTTTYPPTIAGDLVLVPVTVRTIIPRPPEMRIEGIGHVLRLGDGARDGTFGVPPDWLGPAGVVPAGDVVVFTDFEGLSQLRVVSTTERLPQDPTRLRPLWHAANSDLSGRPVVAGDEIIDTEFEVLRAFPVDGCPVSPCTPTWTVALPGTAEMLAVGPGDLVYGTSPDDSGGWRLTAVHRTDGAVAWTGAIGGPTVSLAVADDTVYVAAGDEVVAFGAAGCGVPTCEPTWRAGLDGAPVGNLAVANGILFAGTAGGGGQVSAFPASCAEAVCAPIATLPVEGTPTTLVVDGGLLLVTANRVTAFGPGS
jgi:outer membrane protein assembly factor BamB